MRQSATKRWPVARPAAWARPIARRRLRSPDRSRQRQVSLPGSQPAAAAMRSLKNAALRVPPRVPLRLQLVRLFVQQLPPMRRLVPPRQQWGCGMPSDSAGRSCGDRPPVCERRAASDSRGIESEALCRQAFGGLQSRWRCQPVWGRLSESPFRLPSCRFPPSTHRARCTEPLPVCSCSCAWRPPPPCKSQLSAGGQLGDRARPIDRKSVV